MSNREVVRLRKTAVILAGGKGTRLKPYTIALPKPLVPLGNTPIIEIILRQLRKEGFEQVNIAVNHQAELIKAYCGDGEKYGLAIKYFFEDKPLGTIGPLANMKNELPENFVVMNGDVLSDLSYSFFLDEHIKNKTPVTIACYKRRQKIDYGVLEISENKLTGFCEKPSMDYDVSMGVYAFHSSIMDLIPKNSCFGFDELIYKLLNTRITVRTFQYSGYWMDIGRPEDYEQASHDVENGFVKLEED